MEVVTAWASALSAVAAVVAAGAAVWAVSRQTELATRQMQLDHLDRVTKDWRSPYIIACRKQAAIRLLANQKLSATDRKSNHHIDEVLGFIHEIGVLVTNGEIETDRAYSRFYDPVLIYWTVAENYIHSVRKSISQEKWLSIDTLVEKLLRRSGEDKPSAEYIRSWLEKETALA